MVANVVKGRDTDRASQAGVSRERAPSAGTSRPRRVAVAVGLLLLPLAAMILAGVPLLHASGWTGAALVVSGASVLAAGIGLVAGPAHAEHLRTRRGIDGRRR
jgi:hypothetical protein